ncbi:MAG: molybdopterin molybdenumtransferase MoeA [Gammaproteobacteria bacterium]|nr:molybdopterin molybdenumtransferase MoeA [Gammaproteobacteria bacterium]
MDLEKARATLFAQLGSVKGSEHIPLTQALGRVTAEPIYAQLSLPPFPASAMDGYAVRRKDFDEAKPLRLIGQSLAGHPYPGTVTAGDCVRIFTGAVVPDGADLIILQERLAASAVSNDGTEVIHFAEHEPDEAFIRPIGNDIEQGQIICPAGELLTPLLLGSLASAGVSMIHVVRKVRVGVFSSGDELRDPGTPPEELALGQIYDSNAFTVANLLQRLPVELIPLQRLADDEQAVATALADAADSCDLLITSGGVSVGDADFIGATIARLGHLAFWKLNLKPGKPLAFGRIGQCWIFGLPGNPVSTIVTFLLLVKPSLQLLCGGRPPPLLRVNAKLATQVLHTPGRAEYQRGIYREDDNGELRVAHTGDQGSNRLSTFSGANCLIEIPKTTGSLPKDSVVSILPLSDLLA